MMGTEESSEARRKRKEEARLRKKQKIAESGGVRPRRATTTGESSSDGNSRKKPKIDNATSPPKQRHEINHRKEDPNTTGTSPEKSIEKSSTSFNARNNKQQFAPLSNSTSNHRFGRVMEVVPCRNKPRYSTLTIAIPGSILSNCQTRELRTLMIGQIARAATIYHVDEIVVFDDHLGRSHSNNSGWRRPRNDHRNDRDRSHQRTESKPPPAETGGENQADHTPETGERQHHPRSDPQTFMARILQYCECPQYLRRHFFPMHPDLQFAGILAPIDAPHHVREGDRSPYREGVVLERKSTTEGTSLVNCGVRSRPVEIDRQLAPGIRCTVQLDPKDYGRTGKLKGTVVSPSAPRENDGTYWGYTTRMANSINAVFDGCPFEGGYDLKIGTSERGTRSVEEKSLNLPKFRHSLIVFGGVAGIEECVDADETIKIPGSQSKKLFDLWLNTCPYQGSRTIRTEEAVLITLATLSPLVARSSHTKDELKPEDLAIDFSDEEPSDESSSSNSDESSSKNNSDEEDEKDNESGEE